MSDKIVLADRFDTALFTTMQKLGPRDAIIFSEHRQRERNGLDRQSGENGVVL